MFCPVCRSEYRVGFIRCTECDIKLVEPLEAASIPQPVIIFVTADPNEAVLVKSILEGSGVEAFVFDENLSRMSPMALIIGGVKVAVWPDQEGLAREVLVEYRGGAGQDPARGHSNPFRIPPLEQDSSPEPSSAVEESRCPHCRAVAQPEATVCAGCGRQPW